MRKRDRKIRELRLQKLEAQTTLYEARLAILECEHEYVPSAISKATGGMITNGWAYCGLETVFVMKCSKCGSILRDLTEKEYLIARLEMDEGSFLGRSNEMKERLAVLEAEEKSADD